MWDVSKICKNKNCKKNEFETDCNYLNRGGCRGETKVVSFPRKMQKLLEKTVWMGMLQTWSRDE